MNVIDVAIHPSSRWLRRMRRCMDYYHQRQRKELKWTMVQSVEKRPVYRRIANKVSDKASIGLSGTYVSGDGSICMIVVIMRRKPFTHNSATASSRATSGALAPVKSAMTVAME